MYWGTVESPSNGEVIARASRYLVIGIRIDQIPPREEQKHAGYSSLFLSTFLNLHVLNMSVYPNPLHDWPIFHIDPQGH